MIIDIIQSSNFITALLLSHIGLVLFYIVSNDVRKTYHGYLALLIFVFFIGIRPILFNPEDRLMFTEFLVGLVPAFITIASVRLYVHRHVPQKIKKTNIKYVKRLYLKPVRTVYFIIMGLIFLSLSFVSLSFNEIHIKLFFTMIFMANTVFFAILIYHNYRVTDEVVLMYSEKIAKAYQLHPIKTYRLKHEYQFLSSIVIYDSPKKIILYVLIGEDELDLNDYSIYPTLKPFLDTLDIYSYQHYTLVINDNKVVKTIRNNQ